MTAFVEANGAWNLKTKILLCLEILLVISIVPVSTIVSIGDSAKNIRDSREGRSEAEKVKTTTLRYNQPNTTERPHRWQHCPAAPFGNASQSSLHWNEAKIGEISITNRPCLQPNGLPLTRRCVSSEYGEPIWEQISANPTECVTRTKEKLITNRLVELENDAFVSYHTQPAEATRQLKQILQESDFKLIPTDVHFTSRIVEQVVAKTKTPVVCLDLLSIYNRLMGADKEILRATMAFNSTNKLLECFETCIDSTSRERNETDIPPEDQVDRVYLNELGVRAHLAENLSVFYIDPEVANVMGIALYSDPGNHPAPGMFLEKYGEFYYRFLFANETARGTLNENGLEMATYIPHDLWRNLTKYLTAQPLLIVKVYSNDAFFVEGSLRTNRKVFSKIASVTIPGVTGYFEGVFVIIFRNQNMETSQVHPGTGCGYWNYSTWASDGVEIFREFSTTQHFIVCGSHHMTQFAYLIGGDYRFNNLLDSVVITRAHERALDIITLVGCTFSILGSLGIFITVAVFKSWRLKASSKVLLHLCAAIIFQMIIFCFVNTQKMTIRLMKNQDFAGCVAVGAMLQYSVLVQFTWTLVIAFFQFQRYVQVFGSRPHHFVLKSALVGWLLPIIPPAILIAVDRSSYIPFYNSQTGSKICYPSGHGLTFGVILPVALIITANLVIFVMVLWNIRHTVRASSERSERIKILQRIRLMVMMFFLLGLSWVFGLLATMDVWLVFSYLFCITATLQGFVLFVYFIVLDPATRKLWQLACWKPNDKLKGPEVKETEQ